ncbi:MAG: carbohydrate kinase family protein [Clostridia bacterium]|nr:carbohydrate kinase family protein [Clostridia bacterium]
MGGIAVAGNMIVDKIKIVRAFPGRHELTHILSTSDSFGGAACNTGMDLARLDETLDVKIVGVIGDDADGDSVLNFFRQQPNIDISRIRRRGKNAFTDVITEAESRARTFLTFPGSGDEFDLDDVDADHLNCEIFHIGYILLMRTLDSPDPVYGTKMAHLLKRIKDKGILTSVDVVSETGNRYQALVPPSLKYTDFFIVNEIEAGKTVGLELRDEKGAINAENVKEALKRLKDMGVSRWAMIHTPEGGWGLDENGVFHESESISLPEGYIQGTVGAGDAFCAGALYAAYKGKGMQEAIRWGNVVAACSLSMPGGTEGVVNMEEALKRFGAK